MLVFQNDTEGSVATCRRALAMSENQRETQHICLYEIGMSLCVLQVYVSKTISQIDELEALDYAAREY